MKIATWLSASYPTRYRNGLPDFTPGQVYLRPDAESGIEMASFLLDAARRMMAAEEAPVDSSDKDEEEASM